MDTKKTSPPDANDVAAAIIEAATDVDQMKLHKLLYYAQAWFLAWYDEPLFDGKVEAWEHGPYVPRVGRLYAGSGAKVIENPLAGSPANLDDLRRQALDSVIQAYDQLPGTKLADLTKIETPWPEARERGRRRGNQREEITPEAMRSYYRREGRFGVQDHPEPHLSPATRERLNQGDRSAVADAFRELLAEA